MKSSDIILMVIVTLLVIIAVELAAIVDSGNANAKFMAESNCEPAVSNNRLEQVVAGVGENLEIAVNKFCGDRKKK